MNDTEYYAILDADFEYQAWLDARDREAVAEMMAEDAERTGDAVCLSMVAGLIALMVAALR